jgi:hypothetical protein
LVGRAARAARSRAGGALLGLGIAAALLAFFVHGLVDTFWLHADLRAVLAAGRMLGRLARGEALGWGAAAAAGGGDLIAYDATALEGQPTGVGQYVEQLLARSSRAAMAAATCCSRAASSTAASRPARSAGGPAPADRTLWMQLAVRSCWPG